MRSLRLGGMRSRGGWSALPAGRRSWRRPRQDPARKRQGEQHVMQADDGERDTADENTRKQYDGSPIIMPTDAEV